jgi:hypothetical protein
VSVLSDMVETVSHTFPPVEPPERGAVRCGQCWNGELFDGMASFGTNPDGSVTWTHRRGSTCPRCNGTGWVVVRAAVCGDRLDRLVELVRRA